VIIDHAGLGVDGDESWRTAMKTMAALPNVSIKISGLGFVYRPSDAAAVRAPFLANFLLCAVAGTVWYFQFFFYTRGESQMGRFGFSSWTLHMASIIIFGTLWGFAFREWKDAATRLKLMVWGGIGLLVFATIVVGYGNWLAS